MAIQLGICTWAFAWSAAGRRQVSELTEIAAGVGFCSLEGAYSANGSLSVKSPRPERLAVPLASLATLDLHRFSLASSDLRRREAAGRTIGELLRCAAAWDIPSVSISLGPKPAGFVFENEFDRIAEALAPHVAAAQQLGVRLSLENVPDHLLDSQQNMAAMLSAFPTVGLCLDIGNSLADPPLGRWWAELGHRITKIHLSDGCTNNGWFAAELGHGQVDWREVHSCLAETRVSEIFVEAPWDGKTEEAIFVRRLAETTAGLLAGA